MTTQQAGQSSTSVVITITKKLDAISSSAPKYTIFKVHQLLRIENEMAYEPEILAIGPYHRGEDRLQVMEDQKLRFLKASLEQLGEDTDLNKCVEAMRSLEPKARECYSESTNNVNEDEFVEMLLLDACFIIQFMRSFRTTEPTEPCSEEWVTPDPTEPCSEEWVSPDPNEPCSEESVSPDPNEPCFEEDWVIDPCLEEWVSPDPNEPCFEEDWVIASVIRDMILFENQIPLFVLEKLFSMIRLPDQDPIHFHELALKFLTNVLRNKFPNTEDVRNILGPNNWKWSSNPHHDHHILGLLHNLLRSLAVGNDDENGQVTKETSKAKWNLRPVIKRCRARFNFITTGSCRRGQDHMLNVETIPSAAKLHVAGVQFRPKTARSPFDISFKNGVMKIPTFSIVDSTESFYRNLIAYEQYSENYSGHCVTLHVHLMDCLIDSAEDVALLRKYGIVDNALGADEAASDIFNKLVNNVVLSNWGSEFHSQLFKDVNAYCGKRRHRWMAKLRRDYFNSPWALISFLAALFLLLLTLIQTVFSILGFL